MALGALALWLRIHSFHSVARFWDPSEFVWAVEQRYLPHSPYILHLWTGLLVSLVLPVDLGLSLVSLATSLVAILALGQLVRLQTGAWTSAYAACASLSVAPTAVWFSGQQEVYGPLMALMLVALCLLHTGERPFLSGVLFGAAIATHPGALFVAPATAWAFHLGNRRHARDTYRRHALTALLGSALMPALCLAWLAWVFPKTSGAGPSLLAYLRGMGPTEPAAAGALERTANALGLPPLACAMLLLAAAAFVVLRGRVAHLLFWLLYAGPYLAYEILLGGRIELGVYVPFVLPAVAGLLGAAVAPFRRLVASRIALAAVLVAFVPAAWQSFRQGQDVPSRRSFLERPLLRACAWVRENLPSETFVFQPPGVFNPNLVPCYSQRRPILRDRRHGGFRVFTGQRWWPLHPSSFAPITPGDLEDLARSGIPVASLVEDQFAADTGLWGASRARFHWRDVWEGRVYLLEPGPHPLASTSSSAAITRSGPISPMHR